MKTPQPVLSYCLWMAASFYINNTFDGTFTNNANLGTPRVGKAISATEILLGEIL